MSLLNPTQSGSDLPTFAAGLPARRVHGALKRSIDQLRRAEQNAVLFFAEILNRELYRELGYSSIHQYAAEGLGFSRGKTYQFIRLSEQLGRLPVIKRRVAAGEIPWTKARTIAGVATNESQEQWVAEAERSTNRELEEKVRRARREAMARAKADSTGQLVLAAAVAPTTQTSFQSEMAPSAEHAPSSEPRSPDWSRPQALSLADAEAKITLRITLTPEQLARYEALVETLRKQGVQGSRADLVLEALDALASQARDKRGSGEAMNDPASAGSSTRVQSESHYQIVVGKCPDCGRAQVKSTRGDLQLAPAALAAMECDARVWSPGERNRATIPPRVRRTVLARDGHRCQAPGCNHTRFLEVHHVVPRSRGGSNDPENLTVFCSGCHRLAHERSLEKIALYG